jgi:hypothetical protein
MGAAVIDCDDQEVIGCELALRARQDGGMRVGEVCIAGWGTLRPERKLMLDAIYKRLTERKDPSP